jgi:hypothetical protein
MRLRMEPSDVPGSICVSKSARKECEMGEKGMVGGGLTRRETYPWLYSNYHILRVSRSGLE